MELTGQVMTFVITIMTGMLLGVLFDCYRVLRGTFSPKRLVTWFTDLLYWLVATAIVFIALVFSNWGELRFYVFIGILSGLGVYYNWLSLYAIRLFSKTIKLIIAGLSLLKKIFIGAFLKPGRYCMRLVSRPFMFVGHKATTWYRTRWPKPPDDEK
ncbi:MAG: spore cortex biosynthesis protein YabQ [Firmicutes bacterium]|nr:spore cortex biosynthesis protein YabQ [Bacillota bacterium]